MTTTIFSVAPISTADADFRAWGSAISTALATLGFVKTSDTGQVNWTTVAKPIASSTYAGYEVWRFNDAIQSTAPLFFKVEYGSASSGAQHPAVRIGIGKGSDGAGTLTGTLLAAVSTAAGTGNSSVTASNWYMSSGDGSMLCFVPAIGLYNGISSSTFWSFMFDRSRAADGTATGVGLCFAHQVSMAAPTIRTINYAGGNTLTSGVWPAAVPDTSTLTLASGGNVPLFPAILSDGVGNYWQPRSILTGYSNDIGAMSPITVSGWNTYMPITSMTYYGAAGSGLSSSAVRAAIAWW